MARASARPRRQSPSHLAVLFDLDGTLVDSSDTGFALFNLALERFGSPPVTREEFDREVWGVPFEREKERYFPRASAEELYEFYVANYPSEPRPRLKEGALELLDALEGMGVRLGVVTNTHRALALIVLGRAGIAGRFRIVVCGDDVARGKPAPDMVLAACAALGVAPRQTLLVGDTEADVKAGEAAGVASLCLGRCGGLPIKGLADVLGWV